MFIFANPMLVLNYGGFLLPDKFLLFERFNFFLFSLWFWKYDKDKKMFWSNANKMDQSITANGAWSSRQTPKQMWLDCHQLIYEYLLAHE